MAHGRASCTLTVLTPELLADRTAPVILTPHAGELARLVKNFSIKGEGKVEQAWPKISPADTPKNLLAALQG